MSLASIFSPMGPCPALFLIPCKRSSSVCEEEEDSETYPTVDRRIFRILSAIFKAQKALLRRKTSLREIKEIPQGYTALAGIFP